MKCIKSCGSRITLRRALYLAAAQIVLALILAASSGPEQMDGVAGDHDIRNVSSTTAH